MVRKNGGNQMDVHTLHFQSVGKGEICNVSEAGRGALTGDLGKSNRWRLDRRYFDQCDVVRVAPPVGLLDLVTSDGMLFRCAQ